MLQPKSGARSCSAATGKSKNFRSIAVGQADHHRDRLALFLQTDLRFAVCNSADEPSLCDFYSLLFLIVSVMVCIPDLIILRLTPVRITLLPHTFKTRISCDFMLE